MFRPGSFRLACLVCLAAALPLDAQRARPAEPVDLLIVNGSVVDGTGAGPRRADVAVTAGRIVAVGRLARVAARDRLDARGLVVAPGFVDVHTHADRVAETPLAENFVRMGVTTIVAGNCGASPADIGASLAGIRSTGVSVNFATLVGHNSVRSQVMGTARREPTPAELEQMRVLVGDAMAAGAIGLSTGLEYVPGTYAARDELLALAQVAARAGGLYASHMRDEGPGVEAAIEETLAIGEGAGCPVQISHLKIDSPSEWGRAAALLTLIDRGRARGVDVRADQYAYTAASTGLGIRFPSWALEGGQEAIAARLDDEATWDRIRSEMREMLARMGAPDLAFAVVAGYKPEPSRNGKSLAQIALETRGSDALDAQLEVAREMLRAGGAQMVYHVMSERDVARIMKHPHVAVASDASVNTPGVGRPHPRGYGNTVRVLAKYVRAERTIPLGEAIRKMSSLPARHFGFAGRGEIKVGHHADLVLFDPRTVADAATFDAPHAYPAGLPHVLVNGVFVVRDGQHTQARPGMMLSRDVPAGRTQEGAPPPRRPAATSQSVR